MKVKQRLFLWMQGTRDLALLSVGFPAASCPASRFLCDRVNKVDLGKRARSFHGYPAPSVGSDAVRSHLQFSVALHGSAISSGLRFSICYRSMCSSDRRLHCWPGVKSLPARAGTWVHPWARKIPHATATWAPSCIHWPHAPRPLRPESGAQGCSGRSHRSPQLRPRAAKKK